MVGMGRFRYTFGLSEQAAIPLDFRSEPVDLVDTIHVG